MTAIVGVFGISGVGKTTLINAVLHDRPMWIRLSGGTLIQRARGTVARDTLRDLSMEQVLANQRYIVEGVRHFRETTDAPLAFFDGHLLVDLRSTIVDIPLQVISDLHLAGIVVVHDSVTAIADRRLVDGSRRRDQKAPEELDAEQSRTERLSRDYSSKLSIPLEILSAGDVEGLRSFADGLLG